MKNIRKHIFPLMALVVAILLVYRKLPRAYFEQDEWHSFGHYIYLNSLPAGQFLVTALRSGPLSHFTPLSLFFKMTLFRLFGTDASFYFVAGIILHSLIVVISYFFIFQLLRKKLPAFLGSLFLAVNASQHQAVTWIGTFEGSLGATLFGVLSLILFSFYQQKKQKKFFYFSLLTLLVALLFKETAFTFFILLLIFSLDKIVYFGGLLAVYLIFRFSYLFLGVESLSSSVGEGVKASFPSLLYNLVSLPLKLFSQVLIPQELIVVVSKNIALIVGPRLPQLREAWQDPHAFVYDALTISLGFLFLVLIYLVFRGYKQKKPVILGLVLTILTAVPLLILRKYLIFLDSRFLYPASVGVTFLIATWVDFWQKRGNKLVAILPIFLILVQAYFLRAKVDELAKVGMLRKRILQEISNILPPISDKQIVFAESDRQYYGLAERIFPFQSGLGQILLVYRQAKQPVPAKFFTDEFLWGITSQDYQEVDGVGYGFFWGFEDLAKVVEEQGIANDQVFGLSYDSNQERVVDISQRVRDELVGSQTQLIKIEPLGAKADASANHKDAPLAVDGSRTTFWSSEIPYAIPQYFEVDLGRNVKISEIIIDSFDNIDQNEVGYTILFSDDSQKWTEVFRDLRRPPGKDGLVKILLSPINARFIRIEQIGFHQYAPWVIHELSIYEAVD